ncbi:LOW QUALITY PROTEIN: endochitinase CHI3 [Purpureocillium lavendulum]|uniref:chitinase n=1 Tax=Purpureocillium lavendulum TaxID=1247861 RepID=A0AB34FMQ8_9HYPO|nr:LOW QUALITY PROTEIN: endochitinase CHI3 [Purpureocillium lavendulum]
MAHAVIGVAGVLGYLASTSQDESRAPGPGRLAVYWGAESGSTTLDNVCSDGSYNIVNLAFLNYFFSDGGYPSTAIGDLGGPSAAQRQAGATGLQDGSSLIPALQKCQAAGKLLLLSIGGANSFADVTLDNDAQGEQIADTLWNLFLGGQSALRPFGDIKLDGIDLDNESGNHVGYLAMIRRLRAHFSTDGSKPYYLSAAPQCSFREASQWLDVYREVDMVWVQFYSCGQSNEGFEQAVANWAGGIGGAQLFIGALASTDDDESPGYIDAGALVASIQGVKNMGVGNYAGVMLWDAQLAADNGNFHHQIAGNV